MRPARQRLSVLSLLCVTGSVCFAADSGGQVQATLTAHADYDSNIYLNSRQVSDEVTTATAEVGYARDNALVATQVTLGANGTVFADHSDQNTLDPYIRGEATYTPSDKTTVTGSARYERSSLANDTLNTRTTSNNLSFNGALQNLFSEKLGYRLTGSYSEDSYQTVGYADVLSYSGGADAVYAYSPKLTMLAGYTHRESWAASRPVGAGSSPSSKDEIIRGGFEGQLLPKVSGTVSAGWVSRSFDVADRSGSSSFYLSSGLKWVPREKTTITIDASQDYGLTAASQSSKTGMVAVAARQVLTSQWSVDGSLALVHATYDGGLNSGLSRSDDSYRVKARLSYAWTSNVSLEGSIGYSNVDSTISVSTYDRVSAGVGITATF